MVEISDFGRNLLVQNCHLLLWKKHPIAEIKIKMHQIITTTMTIINAGMGNCTYLAMTYNWLLVDEFKDSAITGKHWKERLWSTRSSDSYLLENGFNKRSNRDIIELDYPRRQTPQSSCVLAHTFWPVSDSNGCRWRISSQGRHRSQ